jgi:uncharacterized protein YcbX
MPILGRITIYPVKSLDGVIVEEARVLAAGGLEHDRRWRLIDADGRVIHAKSTPLLLAIRADINVDEAVIRLAVDPAALAIEREAVPRRLASLRPASFPLVPGRAGPCGWLEEAVGRAVMLQERKDGGFPDDGDATGPTVVASATLLEVARWFEFEIDECRRRFRMNLELADCEAFWEDAVASPARPACRSDAPETVASTMVDLEADLPSPEPLAFAIGSAAFRATGVCRRCGVPLRNSRTTEVTPHFRDAFEARRRYGLRADVEAAEWGDCYRLAINTITTMPGHIRCGDDVRLGRVAER